MKAVACYDIGEFARFFPLGKEFLEERDTKTYLAIDDAYIDCLQGGVMGVCLEGRCRTMGCDLVIGSGRVVDKCGVCGGQGGDCSHRNR